MRLGLALQAGGDYFFAPTRAWELLLGATLAIGGTPRSGHRIANEGLAVSSLLGIAIHVHLLQNALALLLWPHRCTQRCGGTDSISNASDFLQVRTIGFVALEVAEAHDPGRSKVRSLPKATDLARSSACTIRHVLEIFMTTYLRVTSAIATLLILTACATTTGGAKPNSAAPGAVAQNPACLTETGRRIAGNDANCSALNRSYSKDEIDRTGSTTADQALRLLDPSITVHH